jgi:hypothetical protein
MSRFHRASMILAVGVAAAVSVPEVSSAGPRGTRHRGGPRAAPGVVHPPRAAPTRAPRPRVRDHRGVVRPPGQRPGDHRHGYWPHYYRYGYWPYFGYYWPYYGYYPYDGYYAPYGYGPPATAEVIAPPPARRGPRVGVAAHAGRLERDDDLTAGFAGLSVRWRGRFLEGEVELGRREYDDSELVERSVAATLYANLGDIDATHPYLLAGAGLLDSERMFGAVGAGLAVPVASQLTLAGDVRAASIGPRDHRDIKGRNDIDRTVEGRLTLIVDF